MLEAEFVRFQIKVEPEPMSGCWLWTGAVMQNGYPVFGIGGRKRICNLAHRASYEHFKGPIPDGLEIDHLCRVRCCVNPQHLEAVTRVENMRRARKTTCRKGHDKSNAYWWKSQRFCRTCRQEVTARRVR